MSKVAREDILKELGKAQFDGVKQAAKEQAKELGLVTGSMPGKANPIVTSALEQVAQQATSVRLNIQRRDPVSGKMTYIRGPGEISAELIAARGLHEVVDDWCGGGEYIVEIHAPGQERLQQQLHIAGQPQEPGYKAKTAVAGGMPVAAAYSPDNYFGPAPRYFSPPQDNSSNLISKMMEMMMAREMMNARMATPIVPAGGTQEVQELKAELQRMRDEQRRSEEERRRQEELERLRREAAEDRRKSEERFEKLLAEMNKDKQPAWVGLASAAMPAVAELMKGKDAALGLLSNTFGTILQAQQAASNQQSETFKMLMNRPSAADEISKMTNVFAQSQLTNLQTINQIVASGLLDKGGGNPIVELLSQIIEQGGQVLQSAVGPKDGQISGMSSSREVIDAEVNPPALEAEETPALNAPPAPQKTYDLNSDPSFRVIIERIRNGGNPREIALRLFRHGKPLHDTQGHPLAKAWCRDPKIYSHNILSQVGGVNEERIEEIVNALLDLAIWVHEGKDPDDFAQVDTRKRRRSKSIPAVSPEAQETIGYSFDPDAAQEPAADEEETEEFDEDEPEDEPEDEEVTADIRPRLASPVPAVSETAPSEA